MSRKGEEDDLDLYEDEVEYTLADSDDEDLDRGITHNVGRKVYSNSYKAPSDDDDDDDNMYPDTWSNKAAVSDTECEAIKMNWRSLNMSQMRTNIRLRIRQHTFTHLCGDSDDFEGMKCVPRILERRAGIGR